jgi:hypothetical protein
MDETSVLESIIQFSRELRDMPWVRLVEDDAHNVRIMGVEAVDGNLNGLECLLDCPVFGTSQDQNGTG